MKRAKFSIARSSNNLGTFRDSPRRHFRPKGMPSFFIL